MYVFYIALINVYILIRSIFSGNIISIHFHASLHPYFSNKSERENSDNYS